MSDSGSRHGGDNKESSEERPLTAYERWELPLMNEGETSRGGSAIAMSKSPRKPAVAAGPPPAPRPPTAAELEAIRQAAWQEGRDEGYQEGLQKGLEEGRKKGHQEGTLKGHAEGMEKGRQEALAQNQQAIIGQMGALNQVMEQLMSPIAREQEELEQALLQLVERLCEQVVERELATPSESLLHIVQRAIQQLPDTESRLKVYLNPRDLAFIREYAPDWPENWQLLDDPAIETGGCRVENARSLVDYTREHRFVEAIEALFQPPRVDESDQNPEDQEGTQEAGTRHE